MKISLVILDQAPELAVWRGTDLLPLAAVAPELDLCTLLSSDIPTRRDLERRLDQLPGTALLDPDQVQFAPPVPPHNKILCAGLNYRSHAEETGATIPQWPTFFTRFPDTLVGHREALRLPPTSTQLDYEGELAVVVGRPCHGPLDPAAILSHVGGYTIFNDASVRDYQFRTSQWTLGKNFPATGGCGPLIVTADELPPGAKGLALRTEVGGETLQSGNTDDLIFDVASLLQSIAEVLPLQTGDLIITGTPAGVGFPRKPPRFLRPGETCSIHVEGIGTLVNPVSGSA